MPAPTIIRKRWSELSVDELYAFIKVRTDVFYVEQKVDDSELDWRDAEPATLHYWIASEGVTAAYLRVLEDAEPEHADARRVIGRVVVHPQHRGRGLARLLLARVIDDWGNEAMMLHAQSYIAQLYQEVGFEPFGEEYLEAGIPHLSMYRRATAG
ncbi:GNAT family N-acetyltransferase [Herbiconiux sp. P15]|uniref:GNAT family N-acetyltransferase n=1 Tax=Herbiconiux liukaitaii TaxID=3342799 RepID=UPI0035BA8389